MVSRHPDGRISEETSRTHVVLKQRLRQRQRRVGTMIAAKSQGSETCVVGGGKKIIQWLYIAQVSNTERKTDLKSNKLQ